MEILTKMRELIENPQSDVPPLQTIIEFSRFHESHTPLAYSIVKCEVLPNSYAKILHWLAVAYKTTPRSLPCGSHQAILRLQEVKLNR